MPEAPQQVPAFSPRARLVLAALVLLGLALRVHYQLDRPFAGDELGSLRYLDESYGHLVSTFAEQLTMNYYLVVLKALRATLGSSTWVLVAPGILAGVATIVLGARLARHVVPERLALATAFLLTVNPCLIDFSVRIRSYMLLVALSLGALATFYDWLGRRSWRNGVRCALWSLAALLMHPNALYQMGFVVVIWLWELRRDARSLASFLLPMGLAAVATAVAYLPIRADMAAFRELWTDDPPTDWGYLPEMGRLFFVGRAWILPSLVLLAVGAWSASQRAPGLARLGLAVLVPMTMASLLGVSHFPWTYARFLMPILPVLLIFQVQGIEHLAARTRWLAGGLLLVLAGSWSPRLIHAYRDKAERPVAAVAAHLAEMDLPPASVFSFDHSLRLQLEALLGEGLFTNLRAYSNRAPEAGPERLVVLGWKVWLDTDAPVRTFGKVSVTTFEAGQPRGALRRLFLALEDSLAEEPVREKFAEPYEALMTLCDLFGRGNRLRYTELFYECEMRKGRRLEAPPQFLRP